MAQTADAVTQMTEDLRAKALPAAAAELETLRAFAAKAQGLPVESVELSNWDLSYWSEKQREANFSITDEETKPFLPLPSVLTGLFALAETLFGVAIKPVAEGSMETWHDDVQCFRVESVATGEPQATFYLDPYARPGEKRGGACASSLLPFETTLFSISHSEIRLSTRVRNARVRSDVVVWPQKHCRYLPTELACVIT